MFRIHLAAAAVVLAAIATGSAASAEGEPFPGNAETMEEAIAMCGNEWTGSEGTAFKIDRVYVGPDGVRPELAVCVDDVSEAHIGCAFVDPYATDFTPAGVIVMDGVTGYVPCNEVSELLARSAEKKRVGALENILQELKTQTNYLRLMCEEKYSPVDCKLLR